MRSSFLSFRKSNTTALLIAVCAVDSVTVAFDGSFICSSNFMPSYTSYFNVIIGTTALSTRAVFIGPIVVGIWTGTLIAKNGRQVDILATYSMNITGAAIAGATQKVAMFIVGGILIGVDCGFAQNAAPAYVTEPTTLELRAIVLGVCYFCGAVGASLAAGMSCSQCNPTA